MDWISLDEFGECDYIEAFCWDDDRDVIIIRTQENESIVVDTPKKNYEELCRDFYSSRRDKVKERLLQIIFSRTSKIY